MKKVLVATDHTKRGVFFGTLVEDNMTENGTVVMADVQQVIYWSAATRGFLGLAATGPAEGSRVTKPSKLAKITGVTCIVDATEEAAARFAAVPWS